ncbi:hypothetical protein BH10PAT1_BH10PAT1_6300 [soil metagenome]
MLKNIVVFSASFTLALIILVVSIFRMAQVNYVFSQSPIPTPSSEKEIAVDYKLPYVGSIHPDSPLWGVKALRDRVWITMTFNPSKKAELDLLFADKRLVQSQILFEKGKADLGVSVLEKAEKYLESANIEAHKAKAQGMDTSSFLQKYTLATLKHRQIIHQILLSAPEDAKPLIIKNENYSINLFEDAKNGLLAAGKSVPSNPFQN